MKIKVTIPADPALLDVLRTIARELRRIADAQERAHPKPQVPSRQVVRFGAPVQE